MNTPKIHTPYKRLFLRKRRLEFLDAEVDRLLNKVQQRLKIQKSYQKSMINNELNHLYNEVVNVSYELKLRALELESLFKDTELVKTPTFAYSSPVKKVTTELQASINKAQILLKQSQTTISYQSGRILELPILHKDASKGAI